MSIRHAVITSVDRDDLPDQGTIIWTETVKAIRRMNPNTTLETTRETFANPVVPNDSLINIVEIINPVFLII